MVFFISLSVEKHFPLMCSFNMVKRKKLLGVRSELWAGWFRPPIKTEEIDRFVSNFLTSDQFINADRYCEISKSLTDHPKQGYRVCCDNAWPYIARKTIDVNNFDWDILNHPAHSFFWPSIKWLFSFHLIERTHGRETFFYEEMKDTMCEWSREVVAETCGTGIQKLISQLIKCLELNEDYIEK